MQPETAPCYCFLLSINLFLAFLKAMGVPTEQNSVRMMFLAITFMPFFILSVMVPEINLGRQGGDFRLPQTVPSQEVPTQLHPRRFSIPLTVLYLASIYFTPTSFLGTLAVVLILKRWRLSFFNWFKNFIYRLAHALRSVPTNNIVHTAQLSGTMQPTRADEAGPEADAHGDDALRSVPSINIDYTAQLAETTQRTCPDDSVLEANPQGNDTINM